MEATKLEIQPNSDDYLLVYLAWLCEKELTEKVEDEGL